MTKYVFLFNLKAEAVRAMIDQPSDRVAELTKTAEAAGGKLEALYWMFGQYDGFVIAELPDSRAAAAISVLVSASGAFAHLETHELIPGDKIPELLADARQVTYQPPGA